MGDSANCTSEVTRKEFLQGTGMLVGAGAIAGCANDGPNGQNTGNNGGDTNDRNNAGVATAAEHTPDHILLINSDDCGQRIGPYAPDVESPNVDELASEGMMFENMAAAAPSCSPSRAALLTGRPPHTNGQLGLSQDTFGYKMHADERTVAGILSENGYQTNHFGKMHVGIEGHDGTLKAKREALGFDAFRMNGHDSDQLVAAFEEYTENLGTNPDSQFMYVNPVNTHRTLPETDSDGSDLDIPDYLPDTDDARKMLARFDEAIKNEDEVVGRVLAALERAGIRENTLIIFTGDHGIPMPRGKPTMYETGVEAPLIVSWPDGGIPRGARTTELASQIDITPTILDIVGIDPSTREPEIHGNSLVSHLQEETETTPREYIFTEKTQHIYYYPQRAIRNERFKLIRRFELNRMELAEMRYGPLFKNDPTRYMGMQPATELYDLQEDPWEQNDLSGQLAHSDVLEELENQLQEWMAETGDPLLDGPIETPYYAREMEALKAEGDRTPEPVPGEEGIPNGYSKFANPAGEFTHTDDRFRIRSIGDVWETIDEYGTVYLDDALEDGSEAVVKITDRTDAEQWAKAGLMVKNDITKAEAPEQGYATVLMTNHPRAYVMWDTDDDGFIDNGNRLGGGPSLPIWLKVSKNGTTITGATSSDGEEWQEIATVEVPSAESTQDVGAFASLKSTGNPGYVEFSEFSVE